MWALVKPAGNIHQMKHLTNAERKSDRELVSSRLINGPPHIVFEAWTDPKLFKTWWVPKSAPIKLVSLKMDVRVGGTYRLTFSMGSESADFFGRYLEVAKPTRLMWTNEEAGADAAVTTTVTFEDMDGKTLVTVRDLYPSKQALDEALATGSHGAMPEQLQQLDQFIGI
jgi:uncharacterized protein YndB with AHSA1/START domain